VERDLALIGQRNSQQLGMERAERKKKPPAVCDLASRTCSAA
jgi:hypothetical protein